MPSGSRLNTFSPESPEAGTKRTYRPHRTAPHRYAAECFIARMKSGDKSKHLDCNFPVRHEIASHHTIPLQTPHHSTPPHHTTPDIPTIFVFMFVLFLRVLVRVSSKQNLPPQFFNSYSSTTKGWLLVYGTLYILHIVYCVAKVESFIVRHVIIVCPFRPRGRCRH